MPEPLKPADGRLSKSLQDKFWNDDISLSIEVLPHDESASLRNEHVYLDKDWFSADLPHRDNVSGNNILSHFQEIAFKVKGEDKFAISMKSGQLPRNYGLNILGSALNILKEIRVGFVVLYLNDFAKQLRAGSLPC